MSERSSSGDITKQAESCWSSLPAFIRVGEFGIKESDSIPSVKVSATSSTWVRTSSGSSGNDRVVGELVDVALGERRLDVVVRGDTLPKTSVASSSRRGWSGFSWSGVTVISRSRFSAS